MALGTPVLSTSKGIEGLEAEPGRHVLVADSAEGLAAHVARILGDPDFGGRVAAAAREFVRQRYDWEACANALEHAILRAVDDHRQRR
jgi:glycosyltransferase involved in cell wall biosynthesis